MPKKIFIARIFVLFTVLSTYTIQSFSQLSISGATCVIKGSTYYQYNINIGNDESTQLTIDLSNGIIDGVQGENISGVGTAHVTGYHISVIFVRWTSAAANGI